MYQNITTTVASANICSAMETGNHFKNVASLKSLMNRVTTKYLGKTIVFLMLFTPCFVKAGLMVKKNGKNVVKD
jgi:hypothetical protein